MNQVWINRLNDPKRLDNTNYDCKPTQYQCKYAILSHETSIENNIENTYNLINQQLNLNSICICTVENNKGEDKDDWHFLTIDSNSQMQSNYPTPNR